MMKLARTAALGLATVAALATMTACGGSDSSASDAPSSAAPTSTSASAGSDTGTDTTAPAPTTTPSTGTSASGDDAEFCQAFAAIPTGLDSDDPDDVVDAAHSFADALGSAPVPSDMPADAQSGLQAYVSTLKGIDSADVAKLANSTDLSDLFGSDTANVQKFIAFVTQACASELGGAGSAPSATTTP